MNEDIPYSVGISFNEIIPLTLKQHKTPRRGNRPDDADIVGLLSIGVHADSRHSVICGRECDKTECGQERNGVRDHWPVAISTVAGWISH